jgi:hypothetical protein
MTHRKAGSPPKPSPKTRMTTEAVARIYRAAALKGNGTIPPGGVEARAALAAAINEGKTKVK